MLAMASKVWGLESLVWEQPEKQVNKMTRQRNYGVFVQKSLVTALSILQRT